MLAHTSNDKLHSANKSYSVSDIEDCFEYIIKKTWDSDLREMKKRLSNPLIKMYVNKIEKNFLRLNISLNFTETYKLLKTTKNTITKHWCGENVSI